MSEFLASKSNQELLEIGERICRSHDEHWVALWAYNIHKLFRSQFPQREVWVRLDELIQRSWDWHLATDLFHDIRKETLAIEKVGSESGECKYLHLGEVVTKSMSNASWHPGLFDVKAPFYVPLIAFDIAKGLGDTKQSEYLHYHIMGLFQHEDRRRQNG